MARIKVSKNLYRGMRIKSRLEVEMLSLSHGSVAWLREDGSWLVRPADFFLRWGDDVLEDRLNSLYYTTPYKSFWAWLREVLTAPCEDS